jgi:hypothetical protein
MDPHPYEVRELVARTFLEFGVGAGSSDDLEETVLIDRGKCAARTYRFAGLMAMWLLEVGILQFYDADGTMLRTVNLLQQRETLKMAA